MARVEPNRGSSRSGSARGRGWRRNARSTWAPGGTFHTVFQGPDATTLDNPGCYLEVVPNRRLVFTTALGPGYRPQDHYIPFTAIITLEPEGKGTRYHVLARHKDEAGTAKQHVAMGFHAGWSKVLDQLVEMAKPRQRTR